MQISRRKIIFGIICAVFMVIFLIGAVGFNYILRYINEDETLEFKAIVDEVNLHSDSIIVNEKKYTLLIPLGNFAINRGALALLTAGDEISFLIYSGDYDNLNHEAVRILALQSGETVIFSLAALNEYNNHQRPRVVTAFAVSSVAFFALLLGIIIKSNTKVKGEKKE